MIRKAIVLLAGVIVAVLPARGEPQSIFDLRDLRPGMRGVARTVFAGQDVGTFELEILGRSDSNRPKGELILFRALGDTMQHIGIVAGMSGSPVTIDGKLLGAVAFAFPFSKDAIGMITPIGEMLEGLDRIDDPAGPWIGAAADLYGPFLASFLGHRVEGDLWNRLLPSTVGSGGGSALISLCAEGWEGELEQEIDSFSRRIGLGRIASSGGGGGDAVANSVEILPGSALAVVLVDGDATMSAIGTVTYRDGDRIVAFGHPLFHAGPVDLPIAAAQVHGIIPSYNASFKMGSPGAIVGTLRQDYRAGVAGRLGETPAQLPVRIVLRGPSGTERFDYRIARGTMLEPTLLGWAVSNSFLRRGWRMGEASFEGSLAVHYNGDRVLKRKDRIASRAPSVEVAQMFLAAVPLLLSNPFEKVVIDSLRLEVSYRQQIAESQLIDVWAEGESVRPGMELSVVVRLQERQGETRDFQVRVGVPERWRGKNLLILTGGPVEMSEWDMERVPARYQPRDLDGLERLLRDYPEEGSLLVRVYSDEEGVLLGDHELGPLPESVTRVLGSRQKRGPARPAPSFLLEERRIDAGGAVRGLMGVGVRVE